MSALLAGDYEHIPQNYNCLPEATSIKISTELLHGKRIVSAHKSAEFRHTIINLIPLSFIVAIGDVRVVESVECSEEQN
jgi:hypothetical protein